MTRRYDRYTPYQAWREIYEIPLGAVALVADVGAIIVNVVTFGSVPDNITHGWINYGLAGGESVHERGIQRSRRTESREASTRNSATSAWST